MQYRVLIVLAVIASCAYSAEDGTFICKRVESECGNVETVRLRKARTPNVNGQDPKLRRKPKPKPSSRNSDLEDRLEYLEERIERLEKMNPIFALDTEDSPLSELEEDTCHVWHRGKCFIFVEKRIGVISLKEGQNKCNDLGGELANIFDEGHFRKLENYLRDMMTEEDEMEYFITGMTYDKKTGTILRREGTPADFFRWYSETIYPTSATEDTRIHIQVNQMESRPSGMYNVSPLTSARSALCEIPRRIYERRQEEARNRA